MNIFNFPNGLFVLIILTIVIFLKFCLILAIIVVLYRYIKSKYCKENYRAEKNPMPIEYKSFEDWMEKENITLSDLEEVYIQTTDAGPWAEDVFLILLTNKGETVIPQASPMFDLFLNKLQVTLSGFMNTAVIKAMGCCDNAKFVCWKNPNAEKP